MDNHEDESKKKPYKVSMEKFGEKCLKFIPEIKKISNQ